MTPITAKDILDPETPKRMYEEFDNTVAEVVMSLSDGKHTIPWARAALACILMRPLVILGLDLTEEDIPTFTVFTKDVPSQVQTKQYLRIIRERPELGPMEIVSHMCEVISRLDQYAKVQCADQMLGIDILGLLDIKRSSLVTAFEGQITEDTPSEEVEKIIEEIQSTLPDQLAFGDELPNNQLRPLLQSGALKTRAAAELFVGIGSRADIDGRVFSHTIAEPLLTGLVSPADFALEGTSAIKAQYFSATTLKDSRAAARKYRMLGSVLPALHPGTCGQTKGVPDFVIPVEYYKNFLDCAIWENGKQVWLTEDVIGAYKGKRVELVSPCMCRHQNGICSSCAGWGFGRAEMFFPPNTCIGTHAVTHVDDKVSQMILSAKHLTRTRSIKYDLPRVSKDWFVCSSGYIRLLPQLQKERRHLSLHINRDDIGPLSDLVVGAIDNPESFSVTPVVTMYDETTGSEVECELATDDVVPYLSTDMLEYIAKGVKNVQEVEDTLVVPLKDFPADGAIFEYIVMTADMVAFTNRVTKLFNSGLTEHTTLTGALQELAKTIYHRAEVNFFYVQTMARVFMVNGEDPTDPLVPIVKDPNNVAFESFRKVAIRRGPEIELGFEAVAKYSGKTSTYLPSNRSSSNPYIAFMGGARDTLAEYDETVGLKS